MKNQTALHGRDHCPGGSDPIPCLVPSGDWASAECVVGSSENIPDVGGQFGDDFGDYYIMGHTNPDVFELGPDAANIIRTKRTGTYLVTAWLDLGLTFSNYFDCGIGVQGPNAGFFDYWQTQPNHPDSMIRSSNWTSGTHPRVLRTLAWYHISGPATTSVNVDWYGYLNNFTGVAKATHNTMTFGLEVVRLGIPTATTPIYELGSP